MATGILLRNQMVPTSTEIITPVPTGGVTKGQVVKVGNVLGFAFATVTQDDAADGTVEMYDQNNAPANFATSYTRVTKALIAEAYKQVSTGYSSIFAQNDPVYFNTTTQLATADSTGNYLIGYAKKAAATADTTVLIEFDGTLALA